MPSDYPHSETSGRTRNDQIAALHRTHPGGARRATAEHGSTRGPGWTRRGWTDPHDDTEEEKEDTP